jgi:hypothetical protein
MAISNDSGLRRCIVPAALGAALALAGHASLATADPAPLAVLDDLAGDEWGDEWEDEPTSRLPFTVSGFVEAAAGRHLRTNDAVEQRIGKDYNLAETRAQVGIDGELRGFDYRLRADLVGDTVDDELRVELREAVLQFGIGERTDVRAGRQVLTWGTGDLLFINDLFPKDWQSFLIGRDEDYLKAASDALRTTWYGDAWNVDLIWSPLFQEDNYVDGDRLAYFGGPSGRTAEPISNRATEPDRFPDDGELALRLATRRDGTEYALYGYRGFYPQPDDRRALAANRLGYPRLNVLGASLRRAVGPGIGHAELGWYDSVDNRSGSEALLPHSQARGLVGFEWEAVTHLTIGFQYYLEWTDQHARLERNLRAVENATGIRGLTATAGDELRQLATARITYSQWRGDLIWSLFLFASPSDRDLYLRPNLRYRYSDALTLSVGANVFAGSSAETFFGQFDRDSNAWVRARYRF